MANETVMAPEKAAENPAVLNSTSMAQFLVLLDNLRKSNSESNQASAAARDANGNLLNRTNATNASADSYQAMVDALMKAINQDPSKEAYDLQGRSDQIFSSMAGTIDRSNAVSASKLGAGLLKRGMGNSSQATDAATENARQYQDLYQKLREAAYAQAIKEQQQRMATAQQNFSTATQGAVQLQGLAQRAAGDNATAAGAVARSANQNFGKNITDALSSSVANYAKSGFDNFLQNNQTVQNFGQRLRGMFDPTYSSLPDSFNHNMPEINWQGSYNANDPSQQTWNSVAPSTDYTGSMIQQEPAPFAWAQQGAPTTSNLWYDSAPQTEMFTQPEPAAATEYAPWEGTQSDYGDWFGE